MSTTAWMFIEWREPASALWQTTSDTSLDRGWDYKVYDALAGGRNFTGYIYPHKGLPDDISETVLRNACVRLVDNDEEVKKSKWPDMVAKRLPGIAPPLYKLFHRSGVDYFLLEGLMHSHTWLSLAEVEASLASAGMANEKLHPCYVAVLNRMRELEGLGKETRLILWFDSGPIPERFRRAGPKMNYTAPTNGLSR